MDSEYRVGLAKAAAGWWANMLRQGIAPSLVRHAGHMSLGSALMDATRAPSPSLTAAHIEAFETALVERLVSKLTEPTADARDLAYLAVDYGPEGDLARAIADANLPACPLPFKTKMQVSDDGISVAVGYRAEREWLCRTKRGVIRQLVVDAEWKVYPKDCDEAGLARWERIGRVAREAHQALPEHPEGDPEQIARDILAAAEGGLS